MKYILVVCIKFYEHVEVLLKFKFLHDAITNVFEALRGNPALDHDNNTNMTLYHEYQGMFDIAVFLKKTK